MKISRKNMKLGKKLAGISAEGFSWLDYVDVTSCTDTVIVSKYISEVNKRKRRHQGTHSSLYCTAILICCGLSGSSAGRHLLIPSFAVRHYSVWCMALL